MEDGEAREGVARVEALLGQVEQLGEPAASLASETVQALLQLYGEGLRRIVAGGLAHEVARDELVSHLLVLHDLHPVDLETRIQEALEEVRPYLGSHGGDVEFLGVEDGIARLRLVGSCDGCPSSETTLRLAVEDAIRKAAPELDGVEAEGVAKPSQTLIQLGPVGRRNEHAGDAWELVGALPQLAGGGTMVREVAGDSVLFLKLDQTFYAYRDRCASCSESLAAGDLQNGDLTCAACGHRYDVRRAGRSLDSPQNYLEPLPLVVTDAGLVKVAVPAGIV